MKTYDLQDIDLNVPKDMAFSFISDAKNLPKWTNAFTSINNNKAVMQTPSGKVEIELEVHASAEFGTVDWRMIFPDQSVATAFSRITKANKNQSVYSFVLMPPPVPLEDIEGALEAQSQILQEELKKLKGLLESNG